MKIYSSHLKSTLSFGHLGSNLRKPIFRSSAIFPCLSNKNINTNILFLSYWMLKKNIPQVNLLITLREEYGKVVHREQKIINQARSNKISLKKLLEKINFKKNFFGSIELEIFSSKDLVFPYPAMVLNYVSKESSTFVHSAGRVFNDIEDENSNQELLVPESGIDILPEKLFESFISFVNGPYELKNEIIKIKVFNTKGKIKIKKFKLKKIKPYQAIFIKILNDKEKNFLGGKKGTAKIYHNLRGIFPRFTCGNINKKKTIASLTHTYYDQSQLKNAYWINPDTKNLYDSIVTFPIFFEKNYDTELAVYPIYPKTKINFNLEVYNQIGQCIQKQDSIFKIDGKLNKPVYLNINKFLTSKTSRQQLFAKIIINGGGHAPSRFKFGLNVGNKNKYDLSSNICFSAAECNIKTLKKPSTFRWCPLLNQKNSIIKLSNISYSKKGFREANVDVNFWRVKDNKSISKKIKINDNGNYLFELNKNLKIKKFLDNDSGWVTFRSDNPFLFGWYFEDKDQGIVGGDHCF